MEETRETIIKSTNKQISKKRDTSRKGRTKKENKQNLK